MPSQYNPDKHHRRSIRLQGYDYASAGSYFITICTHQRECLFGEIVDGQMVLNEFGQIAADCWQAIPDHFPHTQLDTFVVMPNHLHGILVMIDDRSYPNDHPLCSNSGKGIALQCPNDHPRSPNDRSYPNDHPLCSNSGKGIAVQCPNDHLCNPNDHPRSPNDHLRNPNDHPRSPNDKPNLNKREFGKMIPGSLPTIVRSYKSATTKHINLLRNTFGTPIWQRNYYEHIIRDDRALQTIRQYIQNNPSAWQEDELYADRPPKP